MERLDKILSLMCGFSRSCAKTAVKQGRVTVEGERACSPDIKIDPARCKIFLDGKEIIYRKHLYIMMNKPPGVVSASKDPKERTVIDILPEEMRRKGVSVAGRLDKDTTGLLILTDDGDFAHNVISPNKGVFKTYEAGLDDNISQETIKKFAGGITISGQELCLPAVLEDLGEKRARVKICEGKYHQVKRMFAAAGFTVLSLERTAVGALGLDLSLDEGQSRYLSEKEAEKIFKAQVS